MKSKPLATVSLDLDNQWSYMKTHGDKEWEAYPSYYRIFVPYILEILRELDIRITFFIVGKDAEMKENKEFLQQIVADGHEIGNHSFNHEVWINSYSREKIEEELDRSEKAIISATDQKPCGFRGPGFSWNEELLESLKRRGYLYDATTFPTFIGPLARMYYFRKSSFTKEERKKRSGLFGSFREGFRRIKPYYYKLKSDGSLLEIPITTLPLFRIPFHMSYLIYLSRYSVHLMKVYLRFAILMCRITGTPVSFLLHPLDVIGGDKLKEIEFFPGMDVSSEKKTMIFRYVINTLKKNFDIHAMRDFALKLTL